MGEQEDIGAFSGQGKRRYELAATVLQDGHVDRITGPRCTIQMSEGPYYGLYMFAHTKEVLKAGTPVFYDEITRRARPRVASNQSEQSNV